MFLPGFFSLKLKSSGDASRKTKVGWRAIRRATSTFGGKGSGGNSWAVKIKIKAANTWPLSGCVTLLVGLVPHGRRGTGLKIKIRYSFSMVYIVIFTTGF
jgi:hypothetical protein